MKMIYRQLRSEEKKELEEYLSRRVVILQIFMFLLAAVFLFIIFHEVYRFSGRYNPSWAQYNWWLIPATICTAFIYWFFRKLTHKTSLQGRIKRDIEEDKAAVFTIKADKVIEVPELEDEGPSFIIKSDENETIIFSGQYLLDCKEKGFPWTEFEIVEGPNSKLFLGIKRIGEPLEPSWIRPPFTCKEFKKYKCNERHYSILDVNFEDFKVSANEPKTKVETARYSTMEKLFYYGTNIEVKLGDHVTYRTMFGRKIIGTVWYMPGTSQKHSSMEYDDIKYWAIMLSNGSMISWVYIPHEVKASKRIKFLSRTEGDIQGLKTTDDIS